MNFEDVSFVGGPLDDPDTADREILDRVPPALHSILRQVNGLVAFRGGLHLRGAVRDPLWHSLRHAWDGDDAIHTLFSAVRPSDVPFGQDALGEQFLLRDGQVWRLSAEIDELEPLGQTVTEFLEEIVADPTGALGLEPLRRFEIDGGRLSPGELLSVYPPYVVDTGGTSARSFCAVPAGDRIRFLAQIAAQLSKLPDGTKVEFKIRPPDV